MADMGTKEVAERWGDHKRWYKSGVAKEKSLLQHKTRKDLLGTFPKTQHHQQKNEKECIEMRKIIPFILLALSLVFSLMGCGESEYKQAMTLYESGEYDAAQTIFEELGGYRKSEHMLKACYYQKALTYAEQDEFLLAMELMEKASGYQDSDSWAQEYKYAYAINLIGFRNQFDLPEIQDRYNLDPSFFMSRDRYGEFVTAYRLFEELVESGYGKNTEYLHKIVGQCIEKEPKS